MEKRGRCSSLDPLGKKSLALSIEQRGYWRRNPRDLFSTEPVDWVGGRAGRGDGSNVRWRRPAACTGTGLMGGARLNLGKRSDGRCCSVERGRTPGGGNGKTRTGWRARGVGW